MALVSAETNAIISPSIGRRSMQIQVSVFLSLLLCASSAAATTSSFELANGDRVTGEVVEQTPDRIVLEHPVFGRIEVPTSELESEGPVKPGLLGTRFMRGWTREFGLGLDGSEGNTVNFNLRSTLELDYEDEHRRWDIDGFLVYKTDDREKTDRNARFTVQRDWLLHESHWYLFARGIYDYDDFKDWKHRISAIAGPGYQILERESLDLRSAVGLSFQREMKGEKEYIFGGYWGVELEWRLNDLMRFRARNHLLPYITETGEYRNVSILGLRIRLTEEPALNLNLGLENEYDSNAVPEDDKNDLTYFSTISISF